MSLSHFYVDVYHEGGVREGWQIADDYEWGINDLESAVEIAQQKASCDLVRTRVVRSEGTVIIEYMANGEPVSK